MSSSDIIEIIELYRSLREVPGEYTINNAQENTIFVYILKVIEMVISSENKLLLLDIINTF